MVIRVKNHGKGPALQLEAEVIWGRLRTDRMIQANRPPYGEGATFRPDARLHPRTVGVAAIAELPVAIPDDPEGFDEVPGRATFRVTINYRDIARQPRSTDADVAWEWWTDHRGDEGRYWTITEREVT